jgi:hypothetical protein
MLRGLSCSSLLTAGVLPAQKLMIAMQIKVTPTFCLYRGTDLVRMVTGINEDNLRGAVKEELQGSAQPLAPGK